MEILKLLIFKNIREMYLKNIILNEYKKNNSITLKEEILYQKLFKKLNIKMKIE